MDLLNSKSIILFSWIKFQNKYSTFGKLYNLINLNKMNDIDADIMPVDSN